jgi:calcium-dependent protein kinase
MHSVVGSPYYLAPEVIQGHYGPECDVWSLGVLMYVLLSGCIPFDGENELEVMLKISSGRYNIKDGPWKHISKKAKDLIKRLLVITPAKRLPIQQVLKDPWMTS